jgi:hypothetical protein
MKTLSTISTRPTVAPGAETTRHLEAHANKSRASKATTGASLPCHSVSSRGSRAARKLKRQAKERRWVFFNNGCIHGIQHSEVVVVRTLPHRSVIRDSVAVFSITRTAGLIAVFAVMIALMLLLSGCIVPAAQKGGAATTMISRAGHTNAASLKQSESSKEPSHQTVQSEQVIEYVLPAGSQVSLGDSRGDSSSELGVRGGTDYGPRTTDHGRWTTDSRPPTPDYGPPTPDHRPAASATLSQPMPVKCLMKDRTETSIGGAQRDTAREWASKAANMQPVMWAGIAMMTLVAGVLAYFGWWTKAAVAVVVGLGMIVVAETLPDHGTAVLLGGLGLFALAALLILYAYHKGQLDKNNNGIPDFLESNREVPY